MEFPRSQNMQPSPHPAWQGNIENVELYRVESSVNTQTTLAAPLLPLCGFLFWHNGQNTMFSLLPPPGGNTSKNKGCVYPCLLSHRLPQDENSDGRGRRTISTSAQSGEKNWTQKKSKTNKNPQAPCAKSTWSKYSCNTGQWRLFESGSEGRRAYLDSIFFIGYEVDARLHSGISTFSQDLLLKSVDICRKEWDTLGRSRGSAALIARDELEQQ